MIMAMTCKSSDMLNLKKKVNKKNIYIVDHPSSSELCDEQRVYCLTVSSAAWVFCVTNSECTV